MKILKWTVVIVIVLIIVALLAIYFNLNSIVRRTIETQATDQLNVRTTLKGASVSLFGGSLGLNDLEVASPPGFEAPNILTLGKAQVNVAYGQLRQDPIHIQQIALTAPQLVIEQSGGKFNFNALMDRASETKQAPPTGGKRSEGQPLHLIIDQLKINKAMVTIRPGIPGVAEEINVRIPKVNMEKVGTGEGNQNGAALKDVVMDVITTLASKAAESGKIPPELKSLLQGNLKEAASKLINQQMGKLGSELEKKVPGQTGEALQGVLNNPNGAATNPTGAIEKGLGGLLGQQEQQAAPKSKKSKHKAATQ